jgi:hypothetical protein
LAERSPRYTVARAFASEAAARDAWLWVSREARACPEANVSVFRALTPDGQHVVVLVAPERPAAHARPLERRLSRCPGALPATPDSGIADALHARRREQAPPLLPPGVTVGRETRRPTVADGLPIPVTLSGHPEPDPSDGSYTPERPSRRRGAPP